MPYSHSLQGSAFHGKLNSLKIPSRHDVFHAEYITHEGEYVSSQNAECFKKLLKCLDL